MDWRSLFRGHLAIPPGGDPCTGLEQHLLDALNPFLGNNSPRFAARLLHTVGAPELLNIDVRLRAYASKAYGHWSSDTLRLIVSCPMPAGTRQSLLFVACAHRDGRERQKAVWHLAQFPGFLSIAAALIRSTDWVPQVQFAARDAVKQLLRTCVIEDVLLAWPIVLRLQGRERASDGWLSEHVERWLLDSPDGDHLRRALSAADRGVRVWAYQKSIERGDISLLPQALMQPNPRIGMHALRYAQATLDASDLASLANAGLDAPHPVVRRESLRALASVDQKAALDVMPHVLLDRSAGVRRLAAYLARQGGADPRSTWRDALGAFGVAAPVGAMASLSEEAEVEDEALLRAHLLARRPILRLHALKGLLRTKRPLSPEEVNRLIQLGGRRVMPVLSNAVRDSAFPLDEALVLRTLADERTTGDGRANLRRLMQVGGLWDHLERLLTLRVVDADGQWFLDAIDDWIERSESYAPLGEVRKRRLLMLTAERVADLGLERASKMEGAIARH